MTSVFLFCVGPGQDAHDKGSLDQEPRWQSQVTTVSDKCGSLTNPQELPHITGCVESGVVSSLLWKFGIDSPFMRERGSSMWLQRRTSVEHESSRRCTGWPERRTHDPLWQEGANRVTFLLVSGRRGVILWLYCCMMVPFKWW